MEDEETFQRLVAGIRGQAPGRGGEAQPPLPPPGPVDYLESQPAPKIDTGGGAYVGGNVNTGGGDFVGRDKIVKAERGGVAISGNVTNSNIATSDHNVVGSTVNLGKEYLQQVYEAIEAYPGADPLDKEDMKGIVEEIRQEDQKGEAADETFIARRLRNLQRMAPDIMDVVLITIANPLAGFGMIAQKVAKRLEVESG
jgi:hypothetical protein